jgi:hypothetical protein
MATFGELIHGRKPEVAKLDILDPMELQAQLLSGELKNWDDIAALGDLWQKYMVGGIENLMPNFTDILKEGGITTQDMLMASKEMIHGEIPEDVKNQVYRSAAFQNLGSGGGPGFLSALQARDLGSTSLDLMNQGANLLGAAGNAAQRWAGMSSGTIMNPQTQMYSPEWFAQFRQAQEAARTANKQMQYNVDAAPDPAWAHRAAMFANILGMAAGGMGGGSLGAPIAAGAGGAAAATGAGGAEAGKGIMASGYGGGPAGQSQFGIQQNPENPGFLQNFTNSYYNQSPGGVPQGFGGLMGQTFGSWFNRSARGG